MAVTDMQGGSMGTARGSVCLSLSFFLFFPSESLSLCGLFLERHSLNAHDRGFRLCLGTNTQKRCTESSSAARRPPVYFRFLTYIPHACLHAYTGPARGNSEVHVSMVPRCSLAGLGDVSPKSSSETARMKGGFLHSLVRLRRRHAFFLFVHVYRYTERRCMHGS